MPGHILQGQKKAAKQKLIENQQQMEEDGAQFSNNLNY